MKNAGENAQRADGPGQALDAGADVLGLRVGGQVGQAARDFEHAQRDDEGRDAQQHAHQAIERPGHQPNAHAQRRACPQRPPPIHHGDAQHGPAQSDH